MNVRSPKRVEHAVASVLAGDASYDDLSGEQQALVRAEWDERIKARRESLDYETEFRAAGLTWVEADADGNTVHRS